MKEQYPDSDGRRNARNRQQTRFTVREAKARFSDLIRLASEGTEVTITVHGQPKARIVGQAGTQTVFRVNRDWLLKMPVAKKGTPAERLVRQEREGRD